MNEESGRRESKRCCGTIGKEYGAMWAIRKRHRCEPKLWAGRRSRGVRRSRRAQQRYLEQDILQRKTHLSLSLSPSLRLLNSHRGHRGEERCHLSLKTPEKTQAPIWEASLSSIIRGRDRYEMSVESAWLHLYDGSIRCCCLCLYPNVNNGSRIVVLNSLCEIAIGWLKISESPVQVSFLC